MCSAFRRLPITPSTPSTLPTKHSKPVSGTHRRYARFVAEQGVVIEVSDINLTGTPGVDSPYIFTLSEGDTIFLSSAFDNFVNAITTRVQIADSEGNIIVDNQGTATQQAKYTELVSSGISPGVGNFTVTITPPPDEEAPDIKLTVVPLQGTSLHVESELTGGSPAEYYNFSLTAGNDIKLAFDPLNKDYAFRVQLYDGAGLLLADNRGTESQQTAYANLTSSTGLTASIGNYTVKVSYADNISTDDNYDYSFQLFSGTNYAVVYNTNVTALPGDNSAAASVTPTADAQLFTRNDFHTIKETPTAGVNIGWLQEDKASLLVYSRISSFNNVQYYNFTFQQGDNLKFGFNNTTNSSDLRVQLLDASGNKVIADNLGTAAQRATYKKLTSSSGIEASTGQYIVKVTYASASSNKTQDYNFQVFSGTSYSATYKTVASAQTYQNAFLSGQIGTGFNAKLAAASYLATASSDNLIDPFANSASTDVITALTKTV